MKYFKKNSTNADEVINESEKNFSYKSLSINNINDSSSSSLASTHQEKSIFYLQSSSMATTTHSNLNDLIIDSFDTSITLQNNTLKYVFSKNIGLISKMRTTIKKKRSILHYRNATQKSIKMSHITSNIVMLLNLCASFRLCIQTIIWKKVFSAL